MKFGRSILFLFAFCLISIPSSSYSFDDEDNAEEKIIADCSFGPIFTEINSLKSFERIKLNGGEVYKDDFLGLTIHMSSTIHRYMNDFFNQDILDEYVLNPKKNLKNNSECKRRDFFCPLEQVFGSPEYVKKLFLLRDSYAINASHLQNLNVDQEQVIQWSSEELSELIQIASMLPSQLFEFIHAGGVHPITIIMIKDDELIEEHETTKTSEYLHKKSKLFTVEDHTIHFYSGWRKMDPSEKKMTFMKAFSRLIDLEFNLIESESWNLIDHLDNKAKVRELSKDASSDFWESFAAYRLYPKRFFDQPVDSFAGIEKNKKYAFMKTVFNGYEFKRASACDNEQQIVTYTDYLGQALLKERLGSFTQAQEGSINETYIELEKLCGELLLNNILSLDTHSGIQPMDTTRNMAISDESLSVEEEMQSEEEHEEKREHTDVTPSDSYGDALPTDIFIKKEKREGKALSEYQIRKAALKKAKEEAKRSQPRKEHKLLNAIATPFGFALEGIGFVAEKVQQVAEVVKAKVNLDRFKKEGYIGQYKYLDYKGTREMWFEKKTHERSIMDDYFLCLDKNITDKVINVSEELPVLLKSNPYGEITTKYFYMERSKDLFFREFSMQINPGSLGFTHQWFFEKASDETREKVSVFIFSTLFDQSFNKEKFGKLDILSKEFSSEWRYSLGSYYQIYNLIIKMYFFQHAEQAKKIRQTYDKIFTLSETIHSQELKDAFAEWKSNLSEVTQRGDIGNMHSVQVDGLSFDAYNQKTLDAMPEIKKSISEQSRGLDPKSSKEEKNSTRTDARDDLLFIQKWVLIMDQMDLNAAMIKDALKIYFTPVSGKKSGKKADPNLFQTH